VVIRVAMRQVFECVDRLDVVRCRGLHGDWVVRVVLVPVVEFGLPVGPKLLP